MANGSTLVGVKHGHVRVPQLPIRAGAHSIGVERATRMTTKLSKVPLFFEGAGNTSPQRVRLPVPCSLVVKEEECLVLADRSSDGRPKHVAPARGKRQPAGIVKPVVGRQDVVSHEIISAAVETVSA